jgi:hypothetical protein
MYDPIPLNLLKVKQNDPLLNNPNIYRSGCHFMSLLGIAQTIANDTLSYDQINQIYNLAVDQKYIHEDCTVFLPNSIINAGLHKLGVMDKAGFQIGSQEKGINTFWGSVLNTRVDATILCYATPAGEHYCQGDNLEREIYNPFPAAPIIYLKKTLLYQIGEI